MPDQPQTQTLSLRISEGLRKRLDHIRKVTSLRKGEDVSTSEIAKQLLESSPADRLEVTELIREPTECLLRIRKKCEAEQPLSLAEWTVLAYYVQQGADAICNTPVSRESCIAFLEAFQAVYKLRKNPTRQGRVLPHEASKRIPTRGDNAAAQPRGGAADRGRTVRQLC